LNHRKFWAFLFFETIHLILSFDNAIDGFLVRGEYSKDIKVRHHIANIWMIFIILSFLFIMFAGGLLMYHTFLLLSAQTSWEHASRGRITYLNNYEHSMLPFYVSMKENWKRAFCHGGKVTDWKLM
jgi:hypothetical protein